MKLLFFSVAFVFSFQVLATPAQVVIIRHGEKTDRGNQLDQQGCERAFLLPNFFNSNPTIQKYGTPVATFALRPDRELGTVRPIQTIAPTAASLGLIVQDQFLRLDYSGIVGDIMNNPVYNGKTVLIAWEHEAIPGLAQAFGLALTPSTQAWPDVVFDEAWVLTFTQGQPANLQIIPEYVMPTDNPQGGNQWNQPYAGGGGPKTPKSVSHRCDNNDQLNSLVGSIVQPPLSRGSYINRYSR